ncbi:MAG: hypothetical protein AB7N71_10180 [Phycisphaerae bacterium]
MTREYWKRMMMLAGLMAGLGFTTGGCSISCDADDDNVVEEVADDVEDALD